jgi:4-amino-4-deoxy-L-arabinose transferase-like glycosyltransferase
MTDSRKTFIIEILGLSLLIYLIIFLKLGSFHMRWWDESMFAVNTYEMMNNGKYFTPFFDGVPDLFNTKPPLNNWLQIIFVKLFGYNELALRLPSAIAASLSVIIVFIFLRNNYDRLWAWLSALVLLTSIGFVGFHTARTGDSDSLLTLFILAANIYLLKFIREEKASCIFLFFVFITFAFAAKMHAGLLFGPAYLILLYREKKLRKFIFHPFFWSGLLLFVSVAVGLVLLREGDSPGYLREILSKDAGRIFKEVEDHGESPFFYLDKLMKERFSTWFILAILGILLLFGQEEYQEKKLIGNLSLLCLVYFLIITISVTKLEWYDMPLYPYFSIIAGYAIFRFVRKAIGTESKSIVCIVSCLIFSYPLYTAFTRSQGNTIPNGEKKLEACERFIFKKILEGKNLSDVSVYYSGFNGSLLFYKYKLAEQNQKIELIKDKNFQDNDKILVSNDSLKAIVKNTYNFSIIDSYDQAELFQLNGRKNP